MQIAGQLAAAQHVCIVCHYALHAAHSSLLGYAAPQLQEGIEPVFQPDGQRIALLGRRLLGQIQADFIKYARPG